MIYLINPYTPRNKFEILSSWDVPSLALGYLGAVLENNEIQVKIIDADILKLNIQDIIKILEKEPPNIIGITGNVYTAKYSIYTSLKLKKKFKDVKIVLGGPYVTTEYETVLKKNICDIAVLGEGEYTFLELVKRIRKKEDLKKVNGIAYIENNEIIITPPREMNQNLDELPFPAWHLFPEIKKYKNLRGIIKRPYLPILTSRGCPYSCIWCTKCIFGKQIKYRSAENIFNEIKYYVKKFKVKEFIVMDDTFTQNRKRILKLCYLIRKENLKISFNLYNGVRADKIDDQLIKYLKSIGVTRITLGVESGNQIVLNRIKKSLKLRNVINAVKLVKKNKMITDVFIMLGLPFDTKKTIIDTLIFTRSINPDHAYFFLTVPFPGTELFSIVKEKGTFIKQYKIGIPTQINDGEAVYVINDLTKKFLEKKFSEAYKSFYLRIPKILSLSKLYFELILRYRSISQIKWLVNQILSFIIKFKIIRKILT